MITFFLTIFSQSLFSLGDVIVGYIRQKEAKKVAWTFTSNLN